ncbi:MAG: ribosome maturation factor RimM [Ferrovum sp.]|nr:ribosome maturation factor RimM [Ferrovum sp.]NDU86753.1 ribosome maturation factor RimM [Ferrovum sp.]
MGRVGAPFGIKGWIRVHTYSAELDGLANYGVWWIGIAGHYQPYELQTWQVQGGGLVASLSGVNDRGQAHEMRGQEIAIRRTELPALEAGEYYWSDLVGMAVVNGSGQALGVVQEVLETGANPVLVAHDGIQERLIPFVVPVLQQILMDQGVVQVDWEADY